MPQKTVKNTFMKGMNLDADISYQPKGTYRECEEFRVVADSNATMGSLSNVKGNTDLNIALSSGDVIVGSAVLEDYIVLFVYNTNGSYSYIYKVTMVGEVATKTTLWTDNDLSTSDSLHLNPTYPIKAVTRKEAEDIEKVYWVDDNNYLRYLNAAIHLTTDGEIKSVSNSYLSAKTFGTVSDITFTEPVLSRSGSGGLNAGAVQYSYQLYNKNGSESSFSPATGLYHLSSSSDNAADSSEYKGNSQGEESGKSFTFDITLETYAYDSIRLVSIFYDYYSQLPTINIISEKLIPDTGIVKFTDKGNDYIGSYTVEQFTAIAGLYKAKDIASSKNFLFLANTTENYFNIGEYDARAYRFRNYLVSPEVENAVLTHETLSHVTSPNDCTMEYLSDISITVTVANFSTVFSIPETQTVIDVLSITKDGVSTIVGQYERASDSATIAFNASGLLLSGGTYVSSTDTLTFTVASVSPIFNGDGVNSILNGVLEYIDITYSYTDSTTHISANTYEADGTKYIFETNGNWEYKSASNVVLASGSNWDIPMNTDVINYYNNPVNDGDTGIWSDFSLASNGITKGGTGKNISFYFSVDTFTLDDNDYIYALKTTTKSSTVGFDNYCSPDYTANKRGYQRDETYRFGIVFFDQYGRESVVNWIADIRIPSIRTYTVGDNVGGINKGYGISPAFTIENYPTGAVSYKIVRLERSTEDKSIVASGILRPTMKRTSSINNNRQPFHTYEDDHAVTEDWVKYDLQEFISPEISFYKNLQILGSDKIEVHDLDYILKYNPYGHDTNPVGDWTLKARVVTSVASPTSLEISAGKIVQPMLEGETVSISDLSFYGYYTNVDTTDGDEDPQSGIKGTSLIFKPETATDIYGVSGTNEYTDKYIKYGIYKRDVFVSQYGGHTYSDRSNNEYIGASPIVTIPSNLASTGAHAKYGDIFVAFHEQMALSHAAEADNVFLNIMFPVESSINLQLRHDDRFSTVYNNTAHDYVDLREVGVADGTINYSEMYLYNTVYSQENTLKKYFPLPEGEEFEESKSFNTRIIVSEKKFNGEESDSWLSFLTNNFIDVDANYGELINIMDYNNNLLYWQPRAFGLVDVDPRSLITDNNPGALVLGTGAILSRFDNLSTLTGNSDLFGLIKTSKGIYWYDNTNQLIVRYNGKSIERLSKLLGVQSHLNDKQYTTSYVAFDQKYDEILFSLKGSTDKTLVFNELSNSFTGFYNMDSVRYIQYKDRLISTDDNNTLWLHDSVNSEYGVYYGSVTPAVSTIKIPINEVIDVVKVFDAINYTSYSTDADDILNYEDTFNTIRCYNSYQNTDYVTLIPGTNIERKKGLWSLHIPRNAVNVDPSTNPDIFYAGNLTDAPTPRPRIRDTYILMDLTYNNADNYRFNVPFVHTKYRVNFR